MGPKRPRVHDEAHLAFIRRLPCLHPECHNRVGVEAAHVRYGSIEHGKRESGMGGKPSDRWTVPLCAYHHRSGPSAQHKTGERRFWVSVSIDALIVAALLYTASGDDDAGGLIVAAAKRGRFDFPPQLKE